jgi:hypothetical protein
MICSELNKRKIVIEELNYSSHTFGSWYLIFSLNKSQIRLNYDVKENWLLLQSSQKKQWKDVYTQTNVSKVKSDYLIDKLNKLIHNFDVK